MPTPIEPGRPDESPVAEASPDAPGTGEAADGRPGPPARIWALALVAGLIAGLASWLIGEGIAGRFEPALRNSQSPPTAQEKRLDYLGRGAGQTLEATLTFGAMGAALGLALGLAGGVSRGSARVALGGALAGAILGGAAAAALTRVLLPIYHRMLDPDTNDLILGIALQAAVASVVGAVGGAAFGIGPGDRSLAARAALGGLLGAIAGALAYEVIGTMAFPLDRTANPVSATWGSRLFARLAVTLLASAGAAMAVLDPGKRKAKKGSGADLRNGS